MSKTIRQFDYQVTKMNEGDKLPFDPHVAIVLDHFLAVMITSRSYLLTL